MVRAPRLPMKILPSDVDVMLSGMTRSPGRLMRATGVASRAMSVAGISRARPQVASRPPPIPILECNFMTSRAMG